MRVRSVQENYEYRHDYLPKKDKYDSWEDYQEKSLHKEIDKALATLYFCLENAKDENEFNHIVAEYSKI